MLEWSPTNLLVVVHVGVAADSGSGGLEVLGSGSIAVERDQSVGIVGGVVEEEVVVNDDGVVAFHKIVGLQCGCCQIGDYKENSRQHRSSSWNLGTIHGCCC